MELIRQYFPSLTGEQDDQLAHLGSLYREWNERINVISRKDIDHLYEHHVLHALALAKYFPFFDSLRIVDAGTGGGFPGIPLAILNPQAEWVLIDATAKKIKVVQEIAGALSLDNVTALHQRIEEHRGDYDLVVSRAVSTLTQMVDWTKQLVPSGRWLILKGGTPEELRKELPPQFTMRFAAVSDYFPRPYFENKRVVEIWRK